MQRLREDITCSICLDVLNDPVSIECGHNFCRGCLATHWHMASAWGSQCPECRAPCSRDRMTPDTRLRALVEKITAPLREEMEPVRPDRLNQGKGAQAPTGPRRGPSGRGSSSDFATPSTAARRRERSVGCWSHGSGGPHADVPADGPLVPWLQWTSRRRPCGCSTEAAGPADPPQQGPGAQPEPGRPVQLVRLDEEGDLILDEEALSRCLEQGGVGDAPVCLVSIIGEQRRGKSFLMNCLLHRLQRQNQEHMALGGFECRAGTATVTKGVWMWGQPLWVQAPGRKVAVFLVDTEGCLDLQRRMETSIKLSVFSILLSSYWIFNVSSTFTRTEADYLEMFVHVAKEVGETCNLLPFQRLDLLVRDWQLSGAYGVDGGQEYLKNITRDLEDSAERPLVLGALRARGTRCYLLPHPGTGFTKSRAGTPRDMDEDFRQYLCGYVSTVVRSAGTHVRMDRAGQVLTGAQLAARIKGVSRYLKTKRYDFSSPVKMAEAFAAMRQEENRRAVEAARKEYEQFVQKLDHGHQSITCCLRVKPEEMKRRLEGKQQELLKHCRGELLGKDPQKQAALKVLEQGLAGKTSQFLTAYGQRFKEKAMRLGLYIGGSVLAVVGAGVVAGISPSVVVKVGAGGLVLIRKMVGRWMWA